MGHAALRTHERAPRKVWVSTLALLLPLLATGFLPAGSVAAADVHRATLPGVTLLRPVGTRRRPPTSFDATASLRIEIYSLDSDQAVGDPVGPSFATTPTGADHPIQVIGTDGGRGKYRADWLTTDSGQAAGSLLRVEIRLASAAAGPACNAGVSLDAGCIAFFDVGLHKRHHPIVFPDGVKSVTLGRNIPIKFHIARGALTPPDEGATQLTGDPDSPAAAAVPNLDFPFSANDYAPDPDLGGLTVSFDTLFLVFKPDTTVGQANDLLTQIGADIIGGRTGTTDLSGILYLRVPITSHADMDALINELRANPIVQIAVQDAIVGTTEIPKFIDKPDDWDWNVQPDGGNWGLEAMRVPQMWNLNDAVAKSHSQVTAGVLDVGFYTDHPDLLFEYNLDPDAPAELHGTHVAGTIGATYNNGTGTDGVDPFAHLAVDTDTDEVAWGLFSFLEDMPDLDVVNISLGYNWYEQDPPIDPGALLNPAPRDLVESQAAIFELWETLRQAGGQTLPLLVASAGNDSGSEFLNWVDVDAKWNSPWDYAGLADGTPNVLVVEAVQWDGEGGYTRADFSNINGNVSAPGVDIESTGNPNAANPYAYLSGTSQATPHVTGLAAYLKNLDPTLTTAELKYLLTSSANPVGGGASPMVDAFDAVMAIDSLRGNTSILSRLLDIDDGSADGNLRLDCSTSCTDVTSDDIDGDGGPGDGVIDMSDFRRWRDWLLDTEHPAGLALDGASDTLKQDIDHNGIYLGGANENIFPRGDFNGDGILSRTATRYVRGSVDAVDTDLEVLQTLFNDPDYSSGELRSLIDSGDLHVDPSACMTDGITRVRTKIIETADDFFVDGSSTGDVPFAHEYTEPVDSPDGTNYTVRVEAIDTNGNVANVAQETFLVKLGSDSWFTPTSCGNITLTPPTLSLEMGVGESQTPSVTLESHGIAANWEFTDEVANVEPALTGGSLAAGDQVGLDPTVTCPDKAGAYGGLLDLEFTDDAGAVIRTGVPEHLAVDLVCFTGGVTADPTSIEVTLDAGQTAGRSIVLANSGRALTYEAQAGDHLSIDSGASGTLAKSGAPGSQAEIDLTITCPDTPGTYSSSVTFSFEHADGSPVTETVPDSVPVKLTCLGPLHFVQQLVFNASNIGPQYNRDEDQWLSQDSDGSSTFTHAFGGTTITTETTAGPPLGFGAVTSDTAVTASVDPYGRWPSGRSVSIDSSLGYETSFDATTATIQASWTQDYSQSKTASDPVLPEGAFGYTNVIFDITKAATISVTWTCDGEFVSTIRPGPSILLKHGDQDVFVDVPGQTDGCTFEGTLEPGRYSLYAWSALSLGDNFDKNMLTVTRTHGYSMTLTFLEDAPATP